MDKFSDADDDFYITKFESMLKTNSVFFFDLEAFEVITHHYMDNGKISLAKKAIQLGLSQHPSATLLHLIEVELLIFENKLVEADTIVQKLLKLEPNNDEIYIQKANILSKKDQHLEAIRSLEIALSFSDEPEDIYALMGMEFLYLDYYEAARLNFEKCLQADNDDYESLYNVVYCFEMLNQSDKAIDYLKEYINKYPYSEVAWHQLGRQYFTLGAYEEALRAFDYSVIIDEYFLGGYLEKAKTLETLQRYQEAIDNYLICLELKDATSFVYLHIGICYEALKNNKMALKFYDLTVHEDPLLDKGWLALTNLNFIAGNYQKALNCIDKALKIDSENSLYWRKYSQITLKLNLFEESIKGFKKCIKLNDNSLDIWLSYADVLTFIGNFNNLALLLNEAQEMYPNSFEVVYRKACLQMIFNNEKLALPLFESALLADFDYHKELISLFPEVFKLEVIKNYLERFKK